MVEDEPAVLRLASSILERLGYTVLIGNGPNEALQKAREWPGDIHLVISDVVMPEMNGRELTERLSAMRPSLKRLFVWGYTADVIAYRGVLDEDVRFLQKPFSISDMATKVREALDAA